MVIYDSAIVDLTPLNLTWLFIVLITSHDVIFTSEFVLFNNVIIFVVLLGKRAKLLLSITLWVEETKNSLNFLVTSLRKDNGVRWLGYGSSEFRNKHWYILLVSLDYLNTWIIKKSETENVAIRRPGWEHLHAIIEQKEEMLRKFNQVCTLFVRSLRNKRVEILNMFRRCAKSCS